MKSLTSFKNQGYKNIVVPNSIGMCKCVKMYIYLLIGQRFALFVILFIFNVTKAGTYPCGDRLRIQYGTPF